MVSSRAAAGRRKYRSVSYRRVAGTVSRPRSTAVATRGRCDQVDPLVRRLRGRWTRSHCDTSTRAAPPGAAAARDDGPDGVHAHDLHFVNWAVFSDHDYLTRGRSAAGPASSALAPLAVAARMRTYRGGDFEPPATHASCAPPGGCPVSPDDPRMRRIEGEFWTWALANLREGGGDTRPAPRPPPGRPTCSSWCGATARRRSAGCVWSACSSRWRAARTSSTPMVPGTPVAAAARGRGPPAAWAGGALRRGGGRGAARRRDHAMVMSAWPRHGSGAVQPVYTCRRTHARSLSSVCIRAQRPVHSLFLFIWYKNHKQHSTLSNQRMFCPCYGRGSLCG